MTILEPRLLGRLERLAMMTKSRLVGVFSGEHRSRRHGSSLDFSDYREYHPGDDFRRIDYHMLARLDVLLIKLFEAEDDIEVRLLVDTSKSMTGAKLERAKEIAAALGFISLLRRDILRLYTFPAAQPGPRMIGRAAAGHLFQRLETLEAQGETHFVEAAAHMLMRTHRSGISIVISDLLTGEWEEGIRQLATSAHSDVVVVHLLAPEDLNPDLEGDLDLHDVETNKVVAVSLTPSTIKDYSTIANRWAETVAEACRGTGASYLRTFTDDDLEQLLMGSWQQAGLVR